MIAEPETIVEWDCFGGMARGVWPVDPKEVSRRFAPTDWPRCEAHVARMDQRATGNELARHRPIHRPQATCHVPQATSHVPAPASPGRVPYNEQSRSWLPFMEDFKKKLQDEIAALERELRTELPREILKARAHGDLSENAEYHAAKERQRYVDARLQQLQKRMTDWSMVDLSRIPHDRVGLGSKVVVLDMGKDEQITFRLVTSEAADVSKGLISTNSPIGRGLLGKEVGDVVKIQIPGGTREMEILELVTIHDAGSEGL